MKAEEARRISEQNFKGPVIEPLLEVAYARIKEAAEQGRRSVYFRFYGLSLSPFPTAEAEKAVLQRLREEGYTVKRFANNPDLGNSREYNEVSW